MINYFIVDQLLVNDILYFNKIDNLMETFRNQKFYADS